MPGDRGDRQSKDGARKNRARARSNLLGEFYHDVAVRVMPDELAVRNMELFASEVMPKLR
jgi:hypothetical protein